MTPRLWQRVTARMLRGDVSAARRDELIGDLTEDLEKQRRARGRLAAWLWLLREVWSLRSAYRQVESNQRIRWIVAIARDLDHGRRFVRREFIFALLASLTLAVGISGLAVTGGFADAVLFAHLTPVAPDRVFVVTTVSDRGREGLQFSAPEAESLRREFDGSARVASVDLESALVRSGGTTLQTLAEVVSGPFFNVLPVTPVAGRLLTEGDDRPAAPPVIVISDPLWQRLFDRSPSALGSALSLNGTSFDVVGVVPAAGAVSFTAARVDIWVPTEQAAALLNPDFRTNATRRPFMLVGRLRDGVTRPQLSAGLTSSAAGFARQFPGRQGYRLAAGDSRALVGSQRGAAQIVSGLLAALTILVLVVVAANVGGLFMARATARLRAAAVSMSLGAPRAAVLRSILTEGVVVGALAGGGSLIVYAWIRRLLSSVSVLPTLALRFDLPFNAMVVVATMALAVGAGVALALAPALMTSRVNLVQTLRASAGPVLGGANNTRTRQALLMAQVAGSLILVVLAAQFTRGLDRLRTTDLGLDMDRLAIVDLDRAPSVPPERLPELAAATIDAVRALPGVAGAVMSSGAPVNSNLAVIQISSGNTTVDGTTIAEVTPGYFDVVGVRIMDGRGFLATDLPEQVAVVNEVLARRLSPAGSPIGADIDIEAGKRARIIGVARNAHYRTVAESPQPHVYLLVAPRFNRSLVIRAAGDPRPLLPAIQHALDGVGPGVQGFFPRTGRDHLTFDMLPTELAGSAARAISFAAILLSTIGLYGLMSWLVERARPEIGLRIALGAERRDIRRLVLRLAARSVASGLILGAVLAAVLGQLAGSQVVGVSRFDPVSLAVGGLVLAVVVVVASWLPARRASRIDPVTLLRQT